MRCAVYDSQSHAEAVGPTCKMLLNLIVVLVSDVCRQKGSFPGRRYMMEELSSSVTTYGILHIVNGFSTRWAYLLIVS
jgi:hypothetical protein